MISLQASAGGRLVRSGRYGADFQALGMRQPGLGVDAQQFVHAGDEVAGINRPFLHLFALGVGGAHDVAAFEATSGHAAQKTSP